MGDYIFIRGQKEDRLIPKNPAQLRYAEYLQSWRWKYIVRPIRRWIDRNQCRLHTKACSGPLEVHHTLEAYDDKRQSDGSILDVITDPLGIVMEIFHTITVCHHHHGSIHDKR